jgi:hypothetical protein
MRQWRWIVVAGAAALLTAIPPVVAMIPATDSDISAQRLLRKIVASGDVPYVGVAESNASFRFPDFERVQRLIELFGETTTTRVWSLDDLHWRVDELGTIDERGTYSDETGLWVWSSGSRTATRIEGHAPVRFARSADLLPTELGRRLASAANEDETTRLAARRIAGISAAGLRITPRSTKTTVGHVDIWADPTTGLPVAVEVVPVNAKDPLISAQFLDLEIAPPDRRVTRFAIPDDADVNYTEVADFANAVNRYSPFILPDRLNGLPRRTPVARAAATYGDGFDLVAALVLRDRYAPFRPDELDRLPEVEGSFGTARLLATPLLNGLYVERDDIAYMIAGVVGRAALVEAAEELVTNIEESYVR